jgi:mannosyltransferase
VSSLVARAQTEVLDPGSSADPARQTWELVALTALTVIALALRASQLHETLAGDEIFTYQDVVGHSLGTVLTTVNTGGENSPPLFFVLAWLSSKFGDPSIWIRLPSLVLGTATVPLVYAVGRQSVGRAAGLIAAGIMALAPFAVFYGVEARPYATMTFFVALSTFGLLRATRPAAGRGWWALYTLAATAAVYSHYTSIFLLAVQALWSMWICRRRIAPALIANLAIAVLYIPWLPNVRGKALAVIGALYPLGAQRVLTDLLRPIPGHPGPPLSAIPTIPGLIAFSVCVLSGAAALILKFRRASGPALSDRLPEGLIPIAALTLATPVGLLLYSLLFTDLWLPRGLSASMPSAALLIGALLVAMPVRLTALSAAVVAVVLVVGTARSFQPAYARGPFRTIAAYLDRVAAPRDPVALISLDGNLAVREEVSKPHVLVNSIPAMWAATPAGGRAYLMLDELIEGLKGVGTPHRRGFVLLSHKRYTGATATDVLIYRRIRG